MRSVKHVYRFVYYVPALIFACSLGTLVDIALVNLGFYSFPNRPYPTIFTVDVFFSLFVLPFATFLFLYYGERVSPILRLVIILGIGAVAPWLEAESEKWGLLIHSEKWSHIYSFYGYMIYLALVWSLHRWGRQLLSKIKDKG